MAHVPEVNSWFSGKPRQPVAPEANTSTDDHESTACYSFCQFYQDGWTYDQLMPKLAGDDLRASSTQPECVCALVRHMEKSMPKDGWTYNHAGNENIHCRPSANRFDCSSTLRDRSEDKATD